MEANTDTLQKALIAIQKLKAKLLEQQKSCEPIAITGISCRFPDAENKHAFWQLLLNGKNCISAMPNTRWELLENSSEAKLKNSKPFFGGYINNIDKFDAYFFGISPREATRMDPQQRLLLEVSYEAIEDAGICIEALTGSNTGVFVSLYASQLGLIQEIEDDQDALYLPTGNAVSIAANRLSYILDLKGPSFVVDTACSSALVAVNLASLHLQNNLCKTAIVSAASINLLPSFNALLAKAKMLSPDGQCKTFSADANGYVQGEGVASIILKPLSKAITSGDRIYGVIAGSAVNQDGKTNGLTAPNGLQQEAVLLSAYRNANIDPSNVSYVECHGTGTVLGDPIELQAIGEVLGKNRTSEQPCLIGSVKTNIGHLEPAAGLAGLIKMALALHHNRLPPTLNYNSPNPHIQLDKYNLKVLTEGCVWPSNVDKRICGVSGFGFGGTNAHVVLEEAVHTYIKSNSGIEKEIFTLSAKDPTALKLYVKKWINYLEQNTNIPLWELCYQVHLRRSHYAVRLAIEVIDTQDLLKALNLFFEKDELKNYCHSNLANSYIQGQQVDWINYEKNRFCPYFDIPSYPWQPKSYWPRLKTPASYEALSESLHPFRPKKINSPLSFLQFEFQFDQQSVPEILDTNGILHIGYYFEMLAVANHNLFNTLIEQIQFNAPIYVNALSAVKVQLILEKIQDKVNFSFYSLNNVNKEWTLHARGTMLANSHSEKLKFKDTEPSYLHKKGEELYARLKAMGMPNQGSLRWVNKFLIDDKKIFCELIPPNLKTSVVKLKLGQHFSLMDACIQAIFYLMPPDIFHPYVTTEMNNIRFFSNQNPEKLFSSLNNEKGSWTLLSAKNEVIAQCETFTLKPLGQHSKEMHKKNLIVKTFNTEHGVTTFLHKEISNILAMPEKDLSVDIPLLAAGLDSLMALQLIKHIEDVFIIDLSLQQLLKGMSILDITDYILNNTKAAAKIKVENPWLAYHEPTSKKNVKLYCFPYGGAGASIYRDWQQFLPADIEVCPIQLPGRETRLDEPAYKNLEYLIDDLIKNINFDNDSPFAFFGHSLGGLICFELMRELRRRSLALPTHLFVSAYPDPRLRTLNFDNLIKDLEKTGLNLFDENIIALPPEKFRKLVSLFIQNGLVEYNSEMNDEILRILFPLFIADVSLVNNYVYQPDLPFDLPIHVFVGQLDKWILPDDHLGWAEQTTAGCKFYEYRGGHLFIKDQNIKQDVLRIIGEILIKKGEKEMLAPFGTM